MLPNATACESGSKSASLYSNRVDLSRRGRRRSWMVGGSQRAGRRWHRMDINRLGSFRVLESSNAAKVDDESRHSQTRAQASDERFVGFYFLPSFLAGANCRPLFATPSRLG